MNRPVKRRTSRRFLAVSIVMLLILAGGVYGYISVEGYSLIDALYMTVITVSTVGFSEIEPLSDEGKLFTSILILVSVGNLAFVGSVFVRFIIEGELLEFIKKGRVDKKIAKLKDHVIVCGYGRNGEQACQVLLDKGEPFVVIEKYEKNIKKLADRKDILYIEGDASSDEILEFARIQNAKSMIVATHNDADNVFVVLSAREKRSDITIVGRASEVGSDVKLRRAGADNVIMPEKIGGGRMATLVIQPDVVEFMEYILMGNKSEIALEEIGCESIKSEFISRDIRELLSNCNSGIKIIGVKDSIKDKYTFNPPDDHKLKRGDMLFVLGHPSQLVEFKKQSLRR